MNDVAQVAWPELPLAARRDTCETLHLWTQVVGKIRYTRSPWLNHSWHVTLYVTTRGLTTSPIPDGTRIFQDVVPRGARRRLERHQFDDHAAST